MQNEAVVCMSRASRPTSTHLPPFLISIYIHLLLLVDPSRNILALHPQHLSSFSFTYSYTLRKYNIFTRNSYPTLVSSTDPVTSLKTEPGFHKSSPYVNSVPSLHT